MLLSVVLLQNSQVKDYGWCGCAGVCMYVFTYSIIIFHWCHGSSTGLGIHDLIHYPNIKALLSSTGDATLEHLECAPGLVMCWVILLSIAVTYYRGIKGVSF